MLFKNKQTLFVDIIWSGVFFMGSFLMTNPISLVDRGLLRFSISCVGSDKLSYGVLSISSKLSNLLA